MEKVLGQALRKERESRGVSLADIASETRISLRFLKALEEEDYDVFPGKFYIHYYMKNYLQACGADEAAFFNTYQSYLKAALKDGIELPPDQYMYKMAYIKVKRNRRILLAVMALILLGLLAYLLLGPPRLLGTVLSGRSAAAIEVPAFSASLLRSGEEFCLDDPPLRARMEFDSPCWLQLWRGSEKVAEKTFRKGDVFSLSGYHLTLVIANPPALRLRLNGRDVTFFRNSAEALKLAVDPGNLRDILDR